MPDTGRTPETPPPLMVTCGKCGTRFALRAYFACPLCAQDHNLDVRTDRQKAADKAEDHMNQRGLSKTSKPKPMA